MKNIRLGVIEYFKWLFSNEETQIINQINCNHEKWSFDTVTKTIKCLECGKKAFLTK